MINGTTSQILAAWEHIEQLRHEEADSITILCDNPEGPPNNVVIANGALKVMTYSKQ